MIRVAVSGAAGRMGETVCAAVEGADDMELAGRADPALGTALADVLGDADVVVDFSQPDTALDNARDCLEAGVHCVMGTTGADFSELEGVGTANLFVAPNFADRRGADDGGREADRPAHARVRDRRAAPRPEARRAVGHRDPHRGPDRRGRRQRARADPLGAPAGPGGPPGGDLRRRGPDAARSATTRSRASRSCRACCWP